MSVVVAVEMEFEDERRANPIPQERMLCITKKHSTEDETHVSGQTRIVLTEKKRQAEHRLRQQMAQAYTQFDDRDSHEPDTVTRNSQAEHQDVDTGISRQQELDALRAEIVRLEYQTYTMEQREKEMEELRTENQSLRQHILNLTLSTGLCSSFEHCMEQNEIGGTTLLKRQWWSLSCLFARKSNHRPGFDLDDRQNWKAKCGGLQKNCHALTERNHQLQETNEASRLMVAQLNQQIAVLQQSMLKLVEAVNYFRGQSMRLSLENPSSPNAAIDWGPSQHTSDQNDDTWTVFQQSEDDFSELSAFPVISLEFTPTQRIDI